MKIVRIQQTTHQQKSRTKHSNAKCTVWKNLKRAWWCSINYQFTFTILFFSIGANIKSIKSLFFSSTMKVIGNINLFAKTKMIKAFGWTKNTIQWKWLLFIWKRQQKETFKRNAKPEQLNTKTISKQSKMFNEIKEKHLLNKPSIALFFAFSSWISHVEYQLSFPLLIRMNAKKKTIASTFVCIYAKSSHIEKAFQKKRQKRGNKRSILGLFFFSRCCKSSSALKLHHTI